MADGDREARDAWVARVLGVRVGDDEPSEDRAANLKERLQISIVAVKQLTDQAVVARLSQSIKDISVMLQEGKLGPASGMIDVLETQVAEATRAGRLTEATRESGHRVEYAKLLLSWRQAQHEVGERLADLARAILADPEVIQDPRYPEVQEIVTTFKDVVPDFGPQLADVLDELDKLPPGEDSREKLEEARDLVDEYADALEGADDLLELSKLAAADFGVGVVDELRASLEDIATKLKQVG